MLLVIADIKAQENTIVLSKNKATIDGKEYYLHIVEKGQTLYALSKAYGVSVQELVTENPDCVNGLKLNQTLRIPVVKKTVSAKSNKPINEIPYDEAKYFLHKTEQGETVYSITKKYKISEDSLYLLNSSIKNDGLKAGEYIVVPKLKQDAQIVSQDVKDDNVTIEKRFNVAVFLPFVFSGTEQIDPEKIKKGISSFPEKSKIAIEFYIGFILAIDSLQKTGIQADVHFFDSEADTNKILTTDIKSKLKKMDLIIGPLYTNSFVAVSGFAKDNKIPIVSPMSQNNKILLGNIYAAKSTPSIITQVEAVARYIGDHYSNQNVLLVESQTGKESVYNKTARKTINEQLKSSGKKDSVKIANTYDAIQNSLSKQKINVIYFINSNPSFVTDVMSRLNKHKTESKDSIIVFGMESWNDIHSLDYEYMNNLNLHLPSTGFVNYSDSFVVKLVKEVRMRYNTDPGTFVFYGFDVALYYIQQLKYASNEMYFKKTLDHPSNGVYLKFKHKQSSSESGYENSGVFILRNSDYSWKPVN